MHREANYDLVLEGGVGIYRRVDLNSGWGDTRFLIPFDSDLGSLGFRLVGDLICSSLNGILRCYVHPVEGTRALLPIGVKDGQLGIAGLIFEAEFADGVSLTTTTSAGMRDKPEKGSIAGSMPGKGLMIYIIIIKIT
jgi:hypothetical protein